MTSKNKVMIKGKLSIAIADTDNDGVKEGDDDLEKVTEIVEDEAGEISPNKKKEEDEEEDQDES
jgi:hypothetical protein